jgi:hygromycin-B 4-O-kinase
VQLSAGAWSRAYGMTLSGVDVVLRIGVHGDDFAKDRTASNLALPGVPVPNIIETGSISDRQYALSERAWGTALDDLPPTELEATLPSLMHTLDRISEIDISHTDGFGIWTPEERGPHKTWAEALLSIAVETPRVPGWRAELENSKIGMAPFDAGMAKLSGLVPKLPEVRHLIHGDLLSRNVLIDRNAVSAVLDWGNSLFGDYIYDAAWLVYWWPWYPQWHGIDILSQFMKHWRSTGRAPDCIEDRLHAYLIHIGLDAIAYCTFKRRWSEVSQNAQMVLQLCDIPRLDISKSRQIHTMRSRITHVSQ